MNKSMINRLLLLCAGLLFGFAANAQVANPPKYYNQGYVQIKNGAFAAEVPFLGGLNSPEFQSMDLNNDGTNDLFIYDKNDGRYLTFIRKNKSGFQYAPKYEAAMPRATFYCKSADLDSDGKMDLFTLDETRNVIIHKNITQVGDSFPKFKNLGPQYYRNQYDTNFFILYNPFTLASTDMPEISDIDGDGDLDVLAYDATYTIYTLYKDVRIEKGWNSDTFEFQKWDVCFGYFNDFNNTINLGSCPYKMKLKLRHVGGSACFMFDADEDGDKELVLSNIGQKSMLFLTNGKADYSAEYDTMTSWDSIFPRNTTRATTYEFPAGYLFDVDGDGVDDLLTAPNGFADVKETDQSWYYRNHGKNNKPDFQYVRNNFIADKTLDFGAQSAPAFCDIDADGDMDLFIASNGDYALTGGVKDRVAYYKNTGTKDSAVYEWINGDYLGLSSQGLSDLIIRFGDVDGDKDQDMIAGTRIGTVRWYKNTAGVGNPVVLVLEDTNLLKTGFKFDETNAAPVVFDYNNDTLPDMLVGYYNGTVSLFENTGTPGSPAYTLAAAKAWGMRANEWLTNVSVPGFASYGYAVPELIDSDLDGKQEVLLGTAYGVARLYHISGKSVTDSLFCDSTWLWKRSMGDSAVPDFGARLTPAAADIDGDGAKEIFFGCSRGGLEIATVAQSKLSVDRNRKNNSRFAFELFPNPSSDKIWIRRESNAQQWNVVIRDISGRELTKVTLSKGESVAEIDLSDFSPGLYFAEVGNSQMSGVAKFLVQRNNSAW